MSRGVQSLVALLFGSLLIACGGQPKQSSKTTPTTERYTKPVVVEHSAQTIELVPRQPIEVSVEAKRLGSSLRLELTGVGRGHDEGEAFEDPTQWVVQAHADGAALKQLVNGSVRVAREPVGPATGSQWDVVVEFSVVFECPAGTDSIDVHVIAPDATPHSETLLDI